MVFQTKIFSSFAPLWITALHACNSAKLFQQEGLKTGAYLVDNYNSAITSSSVGGSCGSLDVVVLHKS